MFKKKKYGCDLSHCKTKSKAKKEYRSFQKGYSDVPNYAIGKKPIKTTYSEDLIILNLRNEPSINEYALKHKKELINMKKKKKISFLKRIMKFDSDKVDPSYVRSSVINQELKDL